MLTLVPTPIGNLEDMTPRALKALKEARAVYCEDTRRTRALMSHFGISTPLLRYDERDPRCVRGLLQRLDAGEDLALVSDGGLPAVCDPGGRAAALARRAAVKVSALPGPCAIVTALAGSGLPADSFVFLGFLPRSKGRQAKLLRAAAALGRTIAVYESPFRVLELLAAAEEALGPSAQCCAAREISKIHEEWIPGTIVSVRQTLAARPETERRGEFVLIFHPEQAPAP